MTIEFTGKIWYWRGPAPFFFVTVPPVESEQIKAIAASVTYGWGCMYANVRIRQTEWKTALMPKDGNYLVPIKDSIRRAEGLSEDDAVTVVIELG